MTNLSISQIKEQILSGKIKSSEVTADILKRIEKWNPSIGAYLSVFAAKAMEQAQAVDAKIASGKSVGALAGIPIAVKDNMCYVEGLTTCGSKILGNFKSPYNAHVVEKLLAADAVILGKTNMDEFAMGSSTENSGLQKTVNPWDTSRVPGGSSGGSAAAMAAGLCFAALGSDTGGSIRQPASLCGIVGLKPTYGRVSRYGLVAYGSSLDQIGPMTGCVEDAALLLGVLAGHDGRDSTSVDEQTAPVPDYPGQVNKPVEGLKIAIVPELIDKAEANVRDAVKAAVESYKKLGATLVEVQMPHFDYSIAAYYVIATAEASSNLARFDGCHYGYRSPNARDYIEIYSKSRAEGFGAEVKRRIMLGTFALSSGYYDAYYLKALKVRNLIRQDFTNAFAKADCLMMPVAPTTAFKIGEKTDDPLQMYLADVYTIAVNLAGVPGLSIPCGFDNKRLPIGLQIIGPAFSEDKLLRIGRMFESKTDYHQQRPTLQG
jgi:aspartyl-tRNA(Asn)/glutamyl-tRNA(Gln) amidotransferase subunit A